MAKKKSKKQQIFINRYKRVDKKGNLYIVKPHKRHKRKVGTKVSYKKIGTFYVAHDQYGNFKGSKVVLNKKKAKEKREKEKKLKLSKRRMAPLLPTQVKQIHSDFYRDRISEKEWREKLRLPKTLKL